MTAELQRLLAERAIERVIKLYFRGTDRLDPDLVRSAYHDDAVDDHGPAFYGLAADYVPWMIEHTKKKYASTMYTLHNVLIDVEGDLARAESYAVGHHVVRSADDELHMDMFGCRYLDRFEDRPGAGWRIAHRIVIKEWRLKVPMEPNATDPAGFWPSMRSRQDLVYARDLPLRSMNET